MFSSYRITITFYRMVHISATIYVLVELGTVEIPTTKKDTMKIITALDEPLTIIHRNIKKTETRRK